MYSQNSEEKHIIEYFDGFTGTLLSIGENDGVTFSNAKRLIELGWGAVLVEPSPVAYAKLFDLHKDNRNVECYELAVSDTERYATLHESAHHLQDKSDYALLSTLNEDEKARWKGVDFRPINVFCVTYAGLLKECKRDSFDFITIDAEGNDLDILKQINLSKTRLICIEWNSINWHKDYIEEYCHKFGLTKLIYQSAENLILTR